MTRFFYVSDSTIPSSKANSIQVMKMCEAFALHFEDLVLFCRSGSPARIDPFQFYGVARTFRLHSIRVPAARFLDRIILATVVARQVWRAGRFSIAYSRDPLMAGLLALPIGPSRQVVFEAHAPPRNRFWRAWYRWMFSRPQLSHVVAISQALADELRRLFPTLISKPIIVAHDGASLPMYDTDAISDWKSPSTSSIRGRVGYVGSLRPGKGMELICQLAPQLPDVEFHVVGGHETELTEWRKRTEAPNLIFHGFVSPAVAGAYIDEFDILLAPYQPSVLIGDGRIDIASWMSPLKIFEYMSRGKPIVASDLPVLREVLHDERTALLALATDAASWKSKIERLLVDDGLRARLGQGARSEFMQSYTWEMRAARILRLTGMDSLDRSSNGPA